MKYEQIKRIYKMLRSSKNEIISTTTADQRLDDWAETIRRAIVIHAWDTWGSNVPTVPTKLPTFHLSREFTVSAMYVPEKEGGVEGVLNGRNFVSKPKPAEFRYTIKVNPKSEKDTAKLYRRTVEMEEQGIVEINEMSDIRY